MKKLKALFVSLFIAGVSTTASAQGGDFDYINVGVGVSGWGIPLYVGVDKTIADKITVGGVLSAQRKTERWGLLGSDFRWVHTIIGIGANANYHILEPTDEFDIYGGATLGYYFWNTRSTESGAITYTGGGSGGFGLGLQVGGRYDIEKVVVHAELGFGTVFSSARVGVSFPF
ncbi:MAG: hypothetical protein ACFCUH_13660 [Flavobacteriales bacterium]|jgi:hypothetical protein